MLSIHKRIAKAIRERKDAKQKFCYEDLPYDITSQIALASVISCQPLEIVNYFPEWYQPWTHLRWKIKNRTDFDLAFMYTNKHFYRLCHLAFLSQNTWSFKPLVLTDPTISITPFDRFCRDIGPDHATYIQCIRYVQVLHAPYTARWIHIGESMQAAPRLRKICLRFERASTFSEGGVHQVLDLRYEWERGVEEVVFEGELPRACWINPLEMQPEPNVFVGMTDLDRLSLIRDVQSEMV